MFNSLAYRNGDNVGNNMIAFLLKRKYLYVYPTFQKSKSGICPFKERKCCLTKRILITLELFNRYRIFKL